MVTVPPAQVASCVSACGNHLAFARKRAIRDFVDGEDFSIFNETVLQMLEDVPELRGDLDLNATNEGISILWLK
jgi:hypothetical protein